MRSVLAVILCALAVTAKAQEATTELGASLVVGNGEIIAGQPAGDENAAALRVFRIADDSWQLAATHIVSDVGPEDAFASVMDLDGDLLAVSAQGQLEARGTVYLFKRDASSGDWMQLDRLEVEGDAARLGAALDIHGDMLLAGAPGINSVVVERGIGTDNRTTARLTADNLAEGDRFGEAVAFDGERIYVGAPGQDSLAGAVYVFTVAESGFVQEARLEAPGYRGLGKALLAPAAGLVLAPAPGLTFQELRDMNLQPGSRRSIPPTSGPIFEFRRDASGIWTHHSVVDSLSDRALAWDAMIPMAATGERLLVGLPSSENGIQMYTRDATTQTWSLSTEVANLSTELGMGEMVAVDGDVVAVLAPAANYGHGAIVVLTAQGDELDRTGRMALVEEVALEASDRVDCEDGSALHFSCSNVDLLAFLPISDLGGVPSTELNDIWGWTDPETGTEYALVGRTDGTSFVDISNPSAPVLIGDLPLSEGARPTSWRDIKVYMDHAFIVADATDDHGMQVFDLSQLRDVSTPPAVFEPLVTYDVVDNAHNIIINEDTGYAFLVGAGGGGQSCGGALHMVNIQDPANPVFEGCTSREVAGGRGTHDAQCVTYNGPDTDYLGREICFNSNGSVLNIADVTDKQNPVTIFNASYPNVRYAHQGWLTDDHSFFYLNDEIDEIGGDVTNTRTLIWDVADLDDPQLAREFLSENTSSDHNLYIRGNLMYQSNYGSGLRIFDISDLTNPVEVGFFDTVTAVPDAPGFIGSWSNYPYFESGTIVVTSINEGLFVLKKREVDI